MDKPKADSLDHQACEQVADALIDLRDALVDTSHALRDVLFQMDTPWRQDADDAAKKILQSLKRRN